MKTYFVKKISSENELDELTEVEIEENNWNIKYAPKSFAKLGYDENGIYVSMKSFEKNIRAEIKERNGAVYTDSCLEFFFMPLVNKNEKYFNFEVNPIGTMLTAVGKERDGRLWYTDGGRDYFKMKSMKNIDEYNGEFWQISYYIPFSLIEKYIGSFSVKEGLIFKGNFFKCGDKTQMPHFLSWSKIETQMPDFHRKEYFSDIVFI